MKNKLFLIIMLVTLMGCEISVKDSNKSSPIEELDQAVDALGESVDELVHVVIYLRGHNAGKIQGMYDGLSCVKEYGLDDCKDKYNKMIDRLNQLEENKGEK